MTRAPGTAPRDVSPHIPRLAGTLALTSDNARPTTVCRRCGSDRLDRAGVNDHISLTSAGRSHLWPADRGPGEVLRDQPNRAPSASTSARSPGAPSSSGSSDGAELGSAVHEYAHGVMDARLTAGPAATAGPVALPPDWALQVPQRLRRRAADRRARRRVRAAGIDPAQVVGIGTDFTACTVLPVLADGTPLCELPEYADRPHAYVKLWKHHAAQPHADRINELAHRRGEPWIAPLRRADLQRVGVRQGAAAARGGPRDLRAHGPLRRGRGLDRLAAHRSLRPQRLHRRLQGHLPGRPLPRPRVPGGAEPGLRRLRRGQARPRDRPARRRRRAADAPRPRRGPGCPRASRSRSATSTPTSPRRPRRPPSPARWSRSWARRPAT